MVTARKATPAQASDPWYAVMLELLRRAELCQPDDLIAMVDQVIHTVGLELTVYLIDYEQQALRAIPTDGAPFPPPLPVDTTMAGRAFSLIRTLAGQPTAHRAGRLWIPLVDGSERLGVVELAPAGQPPGAPSPGPRDQCEMLVHLLGHLITAKMPYGDVFHQIRRSQPMTPGSELLLRLVPPLTFTSDRMVISAIIEPCYDSGGDAFDYAVDGSTVHIAILDAMGKGLSAGVASAVALAAMRATRRAGGGLYAMGRAIDTALEEQFRELRFVTAVLAELHLETGLLRYINAGHPAPLLLRDKHLVRTLDAGRRMPLGFDDPSIQVAEDTLQPGDRLLFYSDGVVEARDPAGEMFGLTRLIELVSRQIHAQQPAPEILRRLFNAVFDHRRALPADDATLLLLDWSRAAAERAVL